jgi:hypothetical protein
MEALIGKKSDVQDPYLELVMNMGGQEIQAHQEHRINEIVPLLSSLDNS